MYLVTDDMSIWTKLYSYQMTMEEMEEDIDTEVSYRCVRKVSS